MEHSQSTSFLIGWQNWTSGPVLRQRQVTEKTSSGKGKGKGNVKGQVYNIEPFHLAFYKPNQASYETRLLTHQVFREAPFNLSPPLFGHCPNSNYTPPPALKRALWGTFFRRDFTILPFLRLFLPFFYHFLWISAPNHPGKGLDPPKIKQILL